MKPNIKIFLLCPIPEGQKPINEYINLKENFLTSWLTLKQTNYIKNFFFFYCFFFIISTLSLFLIHFKINNDKLFILDCFFTNFLVFFLYCINFIRWKEIKTRLVNSRIFYEEGSWYDGHIWEKPFLLIKNDKLLTYQKIEPILQRISRGLILLSYSNILLLILYLL
jgi:hypothetical protein